MKDKSIIYIHTARGGRAVTREFIIFPQLQVYQFSFTGDSGSASTSQIHLQDHGAGLLTGWHMREGKAGGREGRKLK